MTDRKIEVSMGDGYWHEWAFDDLRPGDVFRYMTGPAWNHRFEYRALSMPRPMEGMMSIECKLSRERWSWKRSWWLLGCRWRRFSSYMYTHFEW